MFRQLYGDKGVRIHAKMKINKVSLWFGKRTTFFQRNQVESELKPFFVNRFSPSFSSGKLANGIFTSKAYGSYNIASFSNQKHGAIIRPFNGFDHYFMCARLYLAKTNSGRLQCHVTSCVAHTILVSILNYGVISPQHLFTFAPYISPVI